MTKNIATQYGKDKIRCNGVAPDLILTPVAKSNMLQEMLDFYSKFNAYHTMMKQMISDMQYYS